MYNYEARGGQYMTVNSEFYTLKGYALHEENSITTSMEDYLEMIYRIHTTGKAIRIGAVAVMLNVKPSSATKMTANLKAQGLVSSEKYGYLQLTDEGLKLGQYLVFRHDTVHRLLCHINKTDNELEQTEKIEHFLNKDTVKNINDFLKTCI